MQRVSINLSGLVHKPLADPSVSLKNREIRWYFQDTIKFCDRIQRLPTTITLAFLTVNSLVLAVPPLNSDFMKLTFGPTCSSIPKSIRLQLFKREIRTREVFGITRYSELPPLTLRLARPSSFALAMHTREAEERSSKGHN